MPDSTYSFTVTAKNLDGLIEAAYKNAAALYHDHVNLKWDDFNGLEIVPLAVSVDGTVHMYEARCYVRVPFSAPNPALYFGDA